MTDNFQLIKEFIQSQWGNSFDEFTDAFYTIEIIGRRKDGASIESHKFKSYYIKTIEDIDRRENEIKTICDVLQMRAYISINNKSLRHVTLNTMAEYADRISKDNFEKPYSVFDSCAGKFVDRSSQLWIVDVDKEDADKKCMSIDELVDFYKHIIETQCKPFKKIVTVIPTKSGKHIICHPFDTLKFFDGYPIGSNADALIKKNHNTLLYESIKQGV